MKANPTFKRALAVAATLLTLASCVQKERELPSLSAPGSIEYEADFGSLTLYWTPVDNAGQYFWKVENALGYTVAKGTTTNTSVVVSSLQPATTYTVRVKAVPKGVDAETYAASEFFVTSSGPTRPPSGGTTIRTSTVRPRERRPSATTRPSRPMSSRPGRA